jgi:HD superfamily phosphohydrolase
VGLPTRPKVFRDPIHINLEFGRDSDPDRLVLALMDTREVQRLRHVRQLGLANLVYHGSEHSRFSHSLGVTHLAKRIYSVATAGGAPDRDRFSVVLASALLHDVGHPPFSHAVEKELGVDHEDLTVSILRGPTAVNHVLQDRGGEDLIEQVAGHIKGSSDAPTVQIISSQLDADRLDYVLRDSYYAGVPNAHYDLERILQLVFIDDIGLFFDQKAQFAIEGYFIARYHLYLQLYYHRTVRAAEVMLRALLRRARKLRSDGANLGTISRTVDGLFSDNAAEAAVHLCDHDLWAAFQVWADGHADNTLRDLSDRLLTRRLFKVLEIPTSELQTFYEKQLPPIREVALGKGYDPEYYVLTDTAADTPYKIADVSAGDDESTSIRVRDQEGKVHSLEITSGVIQALQGEAYQRLRLCFPQEIRDDVLKIIR